MQTSETYNSCSATSAQAHNERQSGYQTGQTAGVKMVGNQNKHKTQASALVPLKLTFRAIVVISKYRVCCVLGSVQWPVSCVRCYYREGQLIF